MKDLTTRNVPDAVAEGLAELAREQGMSSEAYRRRLFAEAVAEWGYRLMADDAGQREYQAARCRDRRLRAERRDRDGDVSA